MKTYEVTIKKVVEEKFLVNAWSAQQAKKEYNNLEHSESKESTLKIKKISAVPYPIPNTTEVKNDNQG